MLDKHKKAIVTGCKVKYTCGSGYLIALVKDKENMKIVETDFSNVGAPLKLSNFQSHELEVMED